MSLIDRVADFVDRQHHPTRWVRCEVCNRWVHVEQAHWPDTRVTHAECCPGCDIIDDLDFHEEPDTSQKEAERFLQWADEQEAKAVEYEAAGWTGRARDARNTAAYLRRTVAKASNEEETTE